MARTMLLLMLGGILVALLISPVVFEVGDNALIGAGSAFDGDPPPCRSDRLGVTLTLKGQPSTCQQTPNGYEWRPAGAQPARVAPAAAVSVPQTARAYDACTQAQHGRVTLDGRYICVEGRGVGQYYWLGR